MFINLSKEEMDYSYVAKKFYQAYINRSLIEITFKGDNEMDDLDANKSPRNQDRYLFGIDTFSEENGYTCNQCHSDYSIIQWSGYEVVEKVQIDLGELGRYHCCDEDREVYLAVFGAERPELPSYCPRLYISNDSVKVIPA